MVSSMMPPRTRRAFSQGIRRHLPRLLWSELCKLAPDVLVLGVRKRPWVKRSRACHPLRASPALTHAAARRALDSASCVEVKEHRLPSPLPAHTGARPESTPRPQQAGLVRRLSHELRRLQHHIKGPHPPVKVPLP
eukprot:scaffold1223_cov136-Isochrysis_galbana.AAC.4